MKHRIVGILAITAAMLPACDSNPLDVEYHAPSLAVRAASTLTGSATVLGTLGGASYANAVNNGGAVAGVSDSTGFGARAFIWTDTGTMRSLGTLGGNESEATAINDAMQVVGFSKNGLGVYRAFLWSSGSGMRDLGTLGGSQSHARGINEDGLVVGWSVTSSSSSRRPFRVVEGASMEDLGTLGGASGEAAAVNDHGQIVGHAKDANRVTHAVIWTASGIAQLDGLGGPPQSGIASQASAINNKGQVVGFSYNQHGEKHAVLWSPGENPRDLGTLGGYFSYATGINEDGEVVGVTSTEAGQTRAFIWTEAGGIKDLGALENGPTEARGSRSGLAVGFSATSTGDRAILWSATSESPNVPPVPDVGGSYVGKEGAPVAFDATKSSDADNDGLTYTWDFGDGNTGSGPTPLHTYADNGTYTVTLSLSDGQGNTSVTTTMAVIANVAPIVDAGVDVAVKPGTDYVLAATFQDPGADSWTCSVDWGDGDVSGPVSCSPRTLLGMSHKFTGPKGPRVVKVLVVETDAEAESGADQFVLTVATK